MCRRVFLLLLVCGLAAPAFADERTVLGRQLTVRDPRDDDATRRRVSVRGVERDSADAIVGDPTLPLGAGGAVLEVSLAGPASSAQLFGLAQGTRADGAPFWAADGDGFAYADPDGEQGPVASVRLQRTARGAVRMSAALDARHHPLALVPPGLGSEAFVALSLSGGDRYCIGFGSDAPQRSRGTRGWSVRKAPAERCGTPAATSGSFRALSYNVAGLPEGISGSHPEANMPLIAPLLNGWDVVVVQESWRTPDPNPLAPLRVYHEILEAGTDHPYKSVPVPLPLGGNPARPSALVSDGVNVLSRFPFASVVHEPWATCWETAADCLAMKGFMVARTTVAPGVTIDVYTLHMEAGGAPEDDAVRDGNVSQVADFINAYSAGRAVIVGGDFNLHTDSEPDSTQFQRLLSETGLIDVCAALACPQPGRIDKWLFRGGETIAVTPTSWQFETALFQDGAGEPLSDHDALSVDFSWSLLP